MIRLYASDLDGTLLKDATHFHSDALALLRERVAQGAIFVAVSGRSVASCRVLFESAGFALRYCIGVNGAHVAWGETGETLWMRSMPEEAARGAVRTRPGAGTVKARRVAGHGGTRYCAGLSQSEAR